MFRTMRRAKQALTEEQTVEIFKRGTAGVLGVTGDDGYPYTVPVSYIYDNGKIYFHTAKVGHKIDAIKGDSKVSFCVIDKNDVISEEFTTYYRSVIAFGKARFLDDQEEKFQAMEKLVRSFCPEEDEIRESIEGAIDRMCVVEITVEKMSGKQHLNLMNN